MGLQDQPQAATMRAVISEQPGFLSPSDEGRCRARVRSSCCPKVVNSRHRNSFHGAGPLQREQKGSRKGAEREQGQQKGSSEGARGEHYGAVQGRSKLEPELAELSRLQLPTLSLDI